MYDSQADLPPCALREAVQEGCISECDMWTARPRDVGGEARSCAKYFVALGTIYIYTGSPNQAVLLRLVLSVCLPS